MRVRLGCGFAFVLLLAGLTLPSATSVHDFTPHAAAPPACEAVDSSDLPGHERPLVRARWERAAAVAPNTCLLPPEGAHWDCYYSEPLPGRDERLCWWPIPLGPSADAPPRLDILVDLGLLRSLAQTTLQNRAVQELLGGGSSRVEVRVDDAAASFLVEDFRIQDAVSLSAPPACTPFDSSSVLGAPADAAGVCAMSYPPRAGQCRFVQSAPEGHLCWWGVRPPPSNDLVLEMDADAIRGILNAEDSGAATKWALKHGYITIWSPNPAKRAGIKAALEFGLGPVPDPLPPPGSSNTKLALQGRLFDVSYFPRDGVLTPCARDGQGTWYWLNGFGAPNGFVGSSTIRAMQLYLAEHGQLPNEEDVLDDLLLNHRPGAMVDGPEGPAPVVYLFRPGSPFALIPAIQTGDKVVRLHGDGSVDRELTPAEATAAAGRIAAAKAVAKDVDFNRQPGTLAQDLRFLRYAISRNPAAPQIETVLRELGNGTAPAQADLTGLFPPEAPRLAASLAQPPSVPEKVAAGDAFLLGMASHTLIWQDLIANGAIQPTQEAAP